MNSDEKRYLLYTVYWTQDYPELRQAIDDAIEELVDVTGYQEAKDVIAKIKSTLKDSK